MWFHKNLSRSTMKRKTINGKDFVEKKQEEYQKTQRSWDEVPAHTSDQFWVDHVFDNIEGSEDRTEDEY